MPSIVIYGINYAPEPAGNAPYTTSAAEHLSQSGWDVTVHTGMPHYPQWKKTLASSGTRNGVRVIRHNHHVPSDPTTIGRGLMEASWATSAMRSARRRQDIDLVLGVVPSLSGAWLAQRAAKRSGVPFVLWIQDLMGQAAAQGGVRGADRVASMVASSELRVIRRADQVLVCAAGFADYLRAQGIDEDRISVARNWSLLPDPVNARDEALAGFGVDPRHLVAVHSGNMGSKQGLDIVVEAARLAPNITFILQGDGGDRPRLESTGQGIQNLVFLPSLEAGALADLLSAADVLLLTQRETVTNMSLPSKLTSYFKAGTPIACSINPESEAAKLLDAGDFAFAAEPGVADGLVTAIRRAAESPESQGVIDSNVFGSPGMVEATLRGLLPG